MNWLPPPYGGLKKLCHNPTVRSLTGMAPRVFRRYLNPAVSGVLDIWALLLSCRKFAETGAILFRADGKFARDGTGCQQLRQHVALHIFLLRFTASEGLGRSFRCQYIAAIPTRVLMTLHREDPCLQKSMRPTLGSAGNNVQSRRLYRRLSVDRVGHLQQCRRRPQVVPRSVGNRMLFQLANNPVPPRTGKDYVERKPPIPQSQEYFQKDVRTLHAFGVRRSEPSVSR